MSQMKEQDKNPRKTTVLSRDRQLSGKRGQNNDSEDDPGSQKKNGEDARNIYQRPRRTKEQTNRDEETLEGTNSRTAEAEDQISDLEDRMVEITVTEQNKEKRMKRNEDSLRDLWDNIKRSNICILGVPEGEERKDLRKCLKK